MFRTPTARQWDSAGTWRRPERPPCRVRTEDTSSATTRTRPPRAPSRPPLPKPPKPLKPANQPTTADPTTDNGDSTPDPTTGPTDGDAIAVLPVTSDADSITVVPDAGLLTGDDTVYPVYVDPDVTWGRRSAAAVLGR
ncbi:hypothetical protein ACRAWF_44740 [Streptomyces sp. L7]